MVEVSAGDPRYKQRACVCPTVRRKAGAVLSGAWAELYSRQRVPWRC